jgi:succinate dehydrogenase / fumarate reductase cytochrome b subunit
VRGEAYGNVVIGFQTMWVALFYLGAMAFLALHLYHGAWAAFRTLGIARPSNDPLHRRLALALAVIVPAGFSLLPLSVMLGFIR